MNGTVDDETAGVECRVCGSASGNIWLAMALLHLARQEGAK